MRAFLN